MENAILLKLKKGHYTLFLLTFFVCLSSVGWGQTTVVYETPGVYEWTVPPGVTSIKVKLWGGGGGSGGHGITTGTAGGNGGQTAFSPVANLRAYGGGGSAGAIDSNPTEGGAGGYGINGSININGSPGTIGITGNNNSTGGDGGASPNGGATQPGPNITGNQQSVAGINGNAPGGGAAGSARSVNISSGGGGGGTLPMGYVVTPHSDTRATGGGGGGAYVEHTLTVTPGEFIPLFVGAGGTAGTGDWAAGGAGADGKIVIEFTASCTAPTFTLCPGNITQEADAGACHAVVNYTVTATGTPTPSFSYVFTGATTGSGSGTGSGSVFNVGPTVVTITASNDCVPDASCSFMVSVTDNQPPVVSAPDGGSTVSCLSDAVAPTAPTAEDNCDGTITGVLVGYVDTPNPITCEGTRVYTYSYSNIAAMPSVSYWTYTYTIEVEDFIDNMPDDPEEVTVACASLAIQPKPPVVTDNCGNTIIPTGPTIGGTYDGCEGTIDYSWNYTDCKGNNHHWMFTYIVERQDFTMPANGGTTVACVSEIKLPTPPKVYDNCGAEIVPKGPNLGDTNVFCEGTLIYTWKYEDCAGHKHDWAFTVTIEAKDFTANMPADEGSQIACAAAAIVPTPPAVNDYCGNPITPTGPTTGGTYVDCEGTISYTWTYTDCSRKFSHDWTYTYTVDDNTAPVLVEGAVVPTGQTGMNLCFSAVPTGPSEADIAALFSDNCSKANVVKSGTPTGNDKSWTVTYHYVITDDCNNASTPIDIIYSGGDTEAPVVSAADGFETIECYYRVVYMPTPPTAIDNCSGFITGVLIDGGMEDTPSPLDCEGKRVYTFKYVDAAGNTSFWTYTYNVVVLDFTLPENGTGTVECASAAIAEAVTLPIAKSSDCEDAPEIAPSDPVTNKEGTDTYDGCEGTISYTWTYTDCSGNFSHDWTYTYTIEYEDFTMPSDDGTTVACESLATQPTPPEVTDNCGNTITPTGPEIGGIYSGKATQICEGTITYTWTYTDCADNSHDWVYTYTIEVLDFIANMPGNDGTTVACSSEIVEPEPPVVEDYCGHEITPTFVSVSDTPECEGDVVYTWNYADCAGNNHDWTYTYTIEYLPFPAITPTTDVVACVADIVLPTLPSVYDNCGNLLTGVSGTQPTAPECEGYMVYTWTYTDCEGNFQVYTHTVTIEYEDFNMPSNSSSTVTCVESAIAPTLPTVYDNCGNLLTPTDPVMSGTLLPGGCDGTVIYTYTYADCEGNTHDWVYTYTVTKRPTTLRFDIDNVYTVQYSDKVILTATLTDNCKIGDDALISGRSVILSIGTQSETVTTINGVASYEFTITQAPGAVQAQASFAADCPYDAAATIQHGFSITQEDAIVDYIGTEVQATVSATSGAATVLLMATIRDAIDGFSGAITNACVRFVNTDNNPPTAISGWLTPGLVNPNDPTVGQVSFAWAVNIGNATYAIYSVGIEVGCYYTGDDDVVLTVYKPVGDFITGGGHIIPTQSGGSYASTPGLKTNFGFNVKFNKKGTNLQGGMNIIFRRMVDGVKRDYQIKTNAMTSLGVNITDPNAKRAEFTSKANLADVTNPLNPIDLGGNLTLRVTMVDRGEPGNMDVIGFTLWDGNVLWYSSNWTGMGTEELNLAGGNLVVYSGFNVGSTAVKNYLEPEVHLPLFNVYPNPFTDKLNFRFIPETDEMAKLELFDITGSLIETVFEGQVYEGQEVQLQYSQNLRVTTMLFYRLTIGKEVRTGKVMYQR